MTNDNEVTITIDGYKELLRRSSVYYKIVKGGTKGGGAIVKNMTKEQRTAWAREMVAKKVAKKKLNITEQKANIK